VIGIFHQAAIHGHGRTIVSCGQLEYFGVTIDDKSKKVGGKQCMRTLEGYVLPLNFFSGLAYLRMVPYSDHEWDSLPHAILTGDQDWDPSVLDYVMDDNEHWFDALDEPLILPGDRDFDEYGQYRHRHIAASTDTTRVQAYRVQTVTDDDMSDAVSDDFDHPDTVFLDSVDYAVHFHQRDHRRVDIFDQLNQLYDPSTLASSYGEEKCHDTFSVFPSSIESSLAEPEVSPIETRTEPRTVTEKEPNYDTMRPLFAWLPTDVIKETFARTTQMARMPMSETLKNFFKSMYPTLNVQCRNEPVATDTVYSDTPAIDDGSTSAQLYFGTKSTLTDVYGMKTDKQFVNTLEDNIRERGAMDSLLSDSAQVEISNKVKTILRNLFIRSWQSEPYKQQQNPAERRFQTVKRVTNNVLDRTGAPAYTWLLCLMYVCYVLNRT
jgi:hypothetical protein